MSASESTILNNHPPQNGATINDQEEQDFVDTNGHFDGLNVSEERYWADYYQNTEATYEWNNGRLEQKPMSDYAQFQLYLWFLNLLKDFLHVNPIARMVGLELGFRMQLPEKTVVRIPDLAVVLNSNQIPLADKDRSYKGIFDICIESISDSKQQYIDRDVIDKKNEYAAAGVSEYYILDERGKETQFYRLTPAGVYVPIRPQDGIIRSTVLPGFQLRYADLYRLPTPPAMLDDIIYRDFTSPYVRAERQIAEEQRQRAEQEHERAEQEHERAEQAHERAEQEHERAEQEHERAERYAHMLRELGVDLDN